MNAIEVEDQVTLVFTTVLDQRVGISYDEDEIQEVTDRAYWEKRGTKTTVMMVDELFPILKSLDNRLELKYNKFYSGLAKDGKPFNFVIFRPKKQAIRIEPRLQKSDEIENKLDAAGLDVLEYSTRGNRYRIRLGKEDIKKHVDLIQELLEQAYTEYGGYNDIPI